MADRGKIPFQSLQYAQTMKYKLIISPQFYIDLQEIYDYISKDLSNPKVASNLVINVLKKISILKSFPYSGQELIKLNGELTDFRYIIYKNYKIYYKCIKDEVIIFNILHSKRNHERLLFSVKEPASQSFE